MVLDFLYTSGIALIVQVPEAFGAQCGTYLALQSP